MDLAGYIGGTPPAPLRPAPPGAIDTLRRLLADVQD
jgi:hypothetical protein